MKHPAYPTPGDIHPIDCLCAVCEHCRPPEPRLVHAFERTSGRMVVGILLGVALTFVGDWLAGGPGLGVMVGL